MAYGIFGGLAEGFGAGYNLKLKQDALEDEKKTNKLRRDNFELEIRKKRTELEEADRIRDVDAWYASTMGSITDAAVKNDMTGVQFQNFTDFRAARKASQQQPQQPQQPQPEQSTGISGLVAGIRRGLAPSPDATPAAGGIAPPAGEPAAAPVARGVQPPVADQPETPKHNPFIPLGAKNPEVYEQRIRLQGQVLEQYFTLRGQPEKAMQVPATIKALLKDNWEERLGMAVPMTLAMSRNGLRQLAGLNDVLPNGFKMDPETGTPDPKSKTWKGVMVTNESTGEQSPMDVTPEMLIALTKRYDVAGAAKDIIEYGDKRASEDRAERGVVVQEGNLGVNQMNARTNARNAATQAAREDRIAQDGARAQDDLNTARIGKLKFPSANGKITLEDEANFTGTKEERAAQKARLQAAIDRDTNGLRIYDAVAGLNPKVNRSTLAAFAQASASGKFRDQTPKMDGERRYVTFAGQKIYLD